MRSSLHLGSATVLSPSFPVVKTRKYVAELSSRRARRGAVLCATGGKRAIRDEGKEASRKYRRTVFDFDAWAKFRSTSRYFFSIASIPSSRIVRSLGPALLWVGGFSWIIAAYETGLDDGLLPSYLPRLTLPNASPQSLTSFALALLLVFRTNVSYARFLEARKMWGMLLNRGRDFQRQVLTYLPEDTNGLHEFTARWISAWGFSLMCHLRNDHILEDELRSLLPREELSMLVLSQVVHKAQPGELGELQMHQNITAFEDILGGCERILSTPVPLSYTRHTARFLLIWLSLLPFGLWSTIGWAMVPTNVLIAALLLGIEEIGVQIEEPFGILALEAICAKLQKNVLDLNSGKEAPTRIVNSIFDVEEEPQSVNGNVSPSGGESIPGVDFTLGFSS